VGSDLNRATPKYKIQSRSATHSAAMFISCRNCNRPFQSFIPQCLVYIAFEHKSVELDDTLLKIFKFRISDTFLSLKNLS
jgi:hypothetical protein